MMDNRTTSEPKVVLITGASSGIGHATALQLAKADHRMLIGARRTDRLESLATAVRESGGVVEQRELDVTSLESTQSFIDTAVDIYGRIDVVVANAGVMPLSPLEKLKIQEWNRMIDVNIRGVLHTIAAALPVFQRQSSGHFVTVASIGAHAVSPTAAVYCATKYAAWALTEGLRLEVGEDIKVTTITPGVVDSELADYITDPDTAEYIRSYRTNSIPGDAIGRAIAYAIDQPAGVDVSEVIVRPTASLH